RPRRRRRGREDRTFVRLRRARRRRRDRGAAEPLPRRRRIRAARPAALPLRPRGGLGPPAVTAGRGGTMRRGWMALMTAAISAAVVIGNARAVCAEDAAARNAQEEQSVATPAENRETVPAG